MVGAGWAIVITIVVLGVVGGAAWILYSRHRAQSLGVRPPLLLFLMLSPPSATRCKKLTITLPPQIPPPSFTSFFPFFHKSDQNSSSYGTPAPRPGGVQGWFGDQVRKFKERNNRTAAGAYESAPRGGAAGGRRGFGPLDPDEAWDARVGNEADNYGPGGYYEEQELGLHSQGPYNNNSRLHADDNTSYGGAHGGGSGGSDSYAMNLAATPRPDDAEDHNRGRSRSREVAGGGGGTSRNPFDDDAAEPSNMSLRGVSPRPMDGETQARRKVTSDNASERRSIFTEQV